MEMPGVFTCNEYCLGLLWGGLQAAGFQDWSGQPGSTGAMECAEARLAAKRERWFDSLQGCFRQWLYVFKGLWGWFLARHSASRNIGKMDNCEKEQAQAWTEPVYRTACMICRREFEIPFSDYRYKDVKYQTGRPHICDQCGRAVQREAQEITGLNPDMLDEHDRVLREYRR